MGTTLHVWNVEASIFQRLPVYLQYRHGKMVRARVRARVWARVTPSFRVRGNLALPNFKKGFSGSLIYS